MKPKRLPRLRLLAAGLFVLAECAAGSAQGAFPDVVAEVKRSVVAVGVVSPLRNPRFRFLGTGFVVGNGNQVVTNAHVLAAVPQNDENEKLVIALSGLGRVLARPVTKEAADPDHDLALLRFEGPPMPALSLGDSATARDGQDVAWTGFPLGGAMGITSVTHRGIISAITPVGQPLVNSARELDTQTLRRLSVGTYSVLQLDIVSYPGNSGSPLYDVNTGEVLGIVNMVFVRGPKESAITNPSGISFAIPSSFLKALLKP